MTLIDRLARARILCVGDVMLDRFIGGRIGRISPEAPVPVLLAGKAQTCPGGAANVARNIAVLGGHCTLLSVVGDDESGRLLAADLHSFASIRAQLIVSPSRQTTEKARFVAQGQQVLRVDREDTHPITQAEADALMAAITEALPGHDMLVLSDYAKGVLTDAVVAHALSAARHLGLPAIVDPKSPALERYRGASVITPNIREIAAATGIEPADDESAARAATAALLQAQCQAVLLTRADKGMTLARQDRPVLHIAAVPRDVFDVAGAGDTVVAALALALGAGGDLEDAARLANMAASIAVGRRGISTVSQSDLLAEALRRGKTTSAKILNREELQARIETWRQDGLTIGFTNGCYDILHLGHIRLLEFARAHCDRLVVAVNDDASVRRLKGEGRPLNGVADRSEVLAALGVVDAVTMFAEETPLALIEMLAPDLLVKGADYTLEQIVGADSVTARGGQVLRFDLVPDKGTGSLFAKAPHLPVD